MLGGDLERDAPLGHSSQVCGEPCLDLTSPALPFVHWRMPLHGRHQLHAVEPLIGQPGTDLGSGPPHAAALRTHRTTGITANEVHLARHVHLVLQGGLLEREEAMALLTPVPLRSALLAGG